MSASIPRPPLPPAPFLVVGLARSGMAAALALSARGEPVLGSDAGDLPDSVQRELAAAGVRLEAPGDGLGLLPAAGTLVKSPGVPQEAAVVAVARKRGIPVVGELEIAWRLLPNRFTAVTGSNGKTTTVELAGAIHRCDATPVAVAGNVGTALSSLVGRLSADTAVVCEASSFQLEDAQRFAPDVAVLLNLAPDHLDRHGSFEAYRRAKLRIFTHQPPGSAAVVPEGLDLRGGGGHARRIFFGRGPGAHLRDRDGRLWWHGEELIPVSDIRLRGAHNRENAMAAAAACLITGVSADAVRAGLESFAGVQHRLEEMGSRDDVTYVNDSKATNVASAVVGISSFGKGVHVILGGRGKGESYDALAGPVAERCRAVYLIGEAAPEIQHALAATGVPVKDCGDLEAAVAAARAGARAGEVVLLSPACASFDQYESFEHRGKHFRALVSEAP